MERVKVIDFPNIIGIAVRKLNGLYESPFNMFYKYFEGLSKIS